MTARERLELVLASASPRRRELLGSARVAFEVEPSLVPEEPLPGEDPRSYVRRMAEAKARVVAARRHGLGDARPVLGADTTVVLGARIIEKPEDRADAGRMLRALSGQEHRVITAFCLVPVHGPAIQREVETAVRFRDLEEAELEDYLDTGDWADKAGAYAIQGGAAGMVATIRGSYTNVVGLPLAEVLESLRGLLAREAEAAAARVRR